MNISLVLPHFLTSILFLHVPSFCGARASATKANVGREERALSVTPYILDGTIAAPNRYPYYAALVNDADPPSSPDPKVFCGGSLIAPDIVLTAAHCMALLSLQSNQSVYIGLENISDITRSIPLTEGVERYVLRSADITIHPRYDFDNKSSYDVAIIRLDGASRKTPVRLNSNHTCCSPGDPLTVFGMGTTTSGGSASANLLEVELIYISNDFCDISYLEILGPGYITDSKMCAVDLDDPVTKDACQGDSGGPLIIKDAAEDVQVGVVSQGFGCAEFPGIYTRVSKVMSWIKKTVCRESAFVDAFNDEPCVTPVMAESPENCAYNGVMKENATIHRNEALCDRGDGGFRFGINHEGALGLWDGSDNLIKKYARNIDLMEIYSDNYMRSIWAWGEESDKINWALDCLLGIENSDTRLRMGSGRAYLLRFRVDGQPGPYDKLMVMDEDGRIEINKEHCELLKHGYE